jgi:dUTP pyrophosphatase
MEIRIINKSKHELPKYETPFSAGMDVKANIEKDIILKPLERILIPTGLYIQLPNGYEAQIRPRSGLALKKGISVLNTPGTIDADYRGEIGIIVINLSDEEVVIKDGERVCQMIINQYEHITWKEVNMLADSSRGEGGFGHTGF